MKSLSSKIIFFLIIVIFTLFLIIRSQAFTDLLVQFALSKVNNDKNSLIIENSRIGSSNITLEGIKFISSNNLPFSLILECQSIQLNYNLINLLMTRNLKFIAKCYDGNITGNINQKSVQIEGISNIDLSLQANLSDIGLVSGKFNSGKINIEKDKINISNFELNHLNTKSPVKLPSFLTKLPGTVTVPIEDLNLSFDYSYPNSNFSNFKFESNLAKASGNLSYIDKSNIKSHTEISLKPAGSTLFGSFLPLISSNVLGSDSTNFTISLDGNIYSAKYLNLNNP